MIEWFARNPVAANILMISIIIVGVLSATRSIPLEVFPSFEVNTVTVTTAYRGATPKSIQDGVTNRIEEAIYNIEGIETISSQSSEGRSRVVAEVGKGYDKRKILNDVKLRVDSLNSLPLDAEKPIVSLSTRNRPVISIAVSGDVDEKALRNAADSVRNDLLAYKDITIVDLLGVSDHEISIEVTPQTLDNFNITLSDIARAIQQNAIDISAGNIKSRDGDILIKSSGQAYYKQDFSVIPIITNLGADPVRLGDIAAITDGYEDLPLISSFNGKPAILIDVTRTGEQSSIKLAEIVRNYISDHNQNTNNLVRLDYWDDDSKQLDNRLSTLVSSGIYGSILVLIVLSLFLRPAIAFWVFLGVPVSFMGAFIFMPLLGGTFNVISLFAFITVLGVVVDDAIVTGENIYKKMREGLPPIEASIKGTKEVAIPVTFGILTTIIAFTPLGNLGENRLGIIATQIPIVVIPILLFSLIESKLVLPSHLSHIKPRKEDDQLSGLSRAQLKISRGFEKSTEKYYQPFLKTCLNNKATTLVVLISASLIILTIAINGYIKFTFFPRVGSEEITFSLKMPDTTAFSTTQKHINTISDAVKSVQNKYTDKQTGESVIRHIYTSIGSSRTSIKPSIGFVKIELLGPDERTIDISSQQIAREVQQLVGDIPGAESLSIRSELARGADPIEIEISGTNNASMTTIGDKVRRQLKQYPQVFDIKDNYSGAKEELNIELKPEAHALGLDLFSVANQVRASVFGIEAQRIQRGRDEVRVMVRLPKKDRSSLDDLKNLPIQIGPASPPIPLSDLAIITPQKSPTTLYRLNRRNIISITADVDKDNANVPAINRELSDFLDQETAGLPDITFSFKGEAEEQSENRDGFKSGGLLVLLAIYILLAIPFKSYGQPLIVMSIMPFSLVGAVIGHILIGYDISILSIVGMMALLGVVVNDSLVLVDYINKQRKRGLEILDAVIASGTARFRPVILTSITTFLGLTPLLFDNSTSSKLLAPMAISLGFGILFATLITLIIIPINYILAHQAKVFFSKLFSHYWQMWLVFWNKPESGEPSR